MTTTDNGQTPETRQVLIRQVPTLTLKPAPQNDLVYRPVDPTDPDFQGLVASVKEFGVKEELVVSLDWFILSGHRRHAAARAARLAMVPCRVEEVWSTDPRFLVLLREYNRQRVKSLDEVLREEIVSADPEEAHRVLVDHRQRVAHVEADIITIRGKKHRARITRAKRPMLDAILTWVQERRTFWPLTERQGHYALLNNPPLRHASKPGSTYANNRDCYQDLCDLVTRARLTGEIPYQAIHDPTRPVRAWNFHRQVGSFIRAEMNNFLKGYYRDLQQSQPNHIEIIGEKNTVDSIIRPLAMEYCLPMTIGRGYSSLPPRWEMMKRFRRSGKEKLILLVMSDFDPEGEDIGHSFARSMRDDFGVEDIVPIKVALTSTQVEEMDLPPLMKAKAGSSRTPAFVEEHGDDVFELEAVAPEYLQAILRAAIDQVLDVDAYNAEVDWEKEEAGSLVGIRRRVHVSLSGLEDLSIPGDEEE